MSDSRYAASALYYLTLVRVHPLYVSKHFLLGPREHGELPFPFVLYSAIHRPFLSACSANRPSVPYLVFGAFFSGNEGHSPRSTSMMAQQRRWFSKSHLQSRFLRHFRHVSIGGGCFAFCLRLLYAFRLSRRLSCFISRV